MVVVLVDGVTTEKEACGTMVDVAKQVWDQYAEGTGASPEAQSKFRIVVLLGSRWDLLDKVANKAARLFQSGRSSRFRLRCASGSRGAVVSREAGGCRKVPSQCGSLCIGRLRRIYTLVRGV